MPAAPLERHLLRARDLVDSRYGPGIFRTADCRKTAKELKDRGVEFTQEPDERFYGIDAGFRDPSGNEWRLVQPLEYDVETLQRAQSNGG